MLINLISHFFEIKKTYRSPVPEETLLDMLPDLQVSLLSSDYKAKKTENSFLFEEIYDFHRGGASWYLLTPHTENGVTYITLEADTHSILTAYLPILLAAFLFFLFISVKIILSNSPLWLIAAVFAMLSLFLCIGAFIGRFSLDLSSERFFAQIERQIKSRTNTN